MSRKTVVGSGWWSAGLPHDWTIGTHDTHSPEFFRTWLALVRRYIAPDRIVVTDSASPLKPAPADRAGVEWIELDRNYGHANDIRVGRIRTKHSGFMRSVYLGATYALACDADYFVYLEQDCVIHGERFLDAIIEGLEHPIALGARTVGGVGISGPAAPMLQQSLMVVAKAGLERFITAILLAPEGDGEVPPEVKFERDLQPFGVLSVPFGRSRPLDFSLPHFYAQHLSRAELTEFLDREPSIPAPAGVAAVASDGEARADQASVEHPVLREILGVWRRRPDLREAYPLARGATVDHLANWALLSGVHEEPALAELGSEIAEFAGRRPGPAMRGTPAEPRRIHIVSLASFPESFRNCAESLRRGLEQGGARVEFHGDVGDRDLAGLARVPADEVVHVMGQGPVSALFGLPTSNWLLTIHGAAPYSLPPDLHPPPDDDLQRLRAHAVALRLVICPSFSARREIAVAYGIPLAAIEAVPHFFDHGTFTPEGLRHEVGNPYFLAVSNYQEKKNYRGLFEGFRRFVERGDSNVRLLIAGGASSTLEALLRELAQRSPAVAGRVEFVGHAGDLAALYRGALALVSVSHQEGFGMPYVEAALCGTAVIGPRQSPRAAAWASQPTREILSGAGLYVDPERPQDLAVAMSLLATDPGARDAVAARCLERARFYVEPEFLYRRYLHAYGRVLRAEAHA